MANVKFLRKEFEEVLGGKVSRDVEEKISLMGTPLESVTDSEIEIEIFPNRPDLLSFQGYMRAFKKFIGVDKKPSSYVVNPPEKNYKVKVDGSVKNTSRPFTVCAIVKSLKLDSEKIKEIVSFQEKIHSTLGRNRKKVAVGVYPLDKINFPVNYEARKPSEIKFVPLEGGRVMSAPQILKKHPKGREYKSLLENDSFYPVFADSKGEILSMPPIINSHVAGKVNEKTESVFLECSGYDQVSLEKTLNIFSAMFADMGGKIYGVSIEDRQSRVTPDFSWERLKFSVQNMNKVLGLELNEKKVKPLLEKMGYKVKGKFAYVPPWRTDILHEIDLTEDVAIAYGYDNFEPAILESSTLGEETRNSKLRRKISEILIGLGLVEISSYYLIKEDEAKKHRFDRIELENAKTEYKLLRPNLILPCLRILSENKDEDYPQRIFEIGEVFSESKKAETGVKEEEKLLVALTPGNFTEVKQILDYFFKMIGLSYSIKTGKHFMFIDGRVGDIYLGSSKIGHIGEVHPSTLRSWSLKMPLVVIEISLEEIFKLI